jgi:two-component system sensor histidine kinase/response regulator
MGEPAEAETVLVIDDDYAMRLSCEKILAKMGLRVQVFEDGARGLSAVADLKPSLLLVDLKMPGISGMEVVARVREIDPLLVVVVITGYATIDTAVEAMKSGAYDFLPKPFSPDELRLVVNRGLERRRLALESQRNEVERALLKRRFITFVSHQLQTPLVAVHQYLDVLQRLDDSEGAAERRREWLDRCLRRTEEMQSLIKDWLTLAKVEGGALSGQRRKLDLKEVISDLVSSYEAMAAAEHVSLELCLSGDPLDVWGDRTCVSVLFENLITNAIKYNKPGGR